MSSLLGSSSSAGARVLARRFWLGALATALAACAVGPDHEVPQRPVPAHWQAAGTGGLAAEARDPGSWWQGLGEARLAQAVELALRQNLDVREAYARLRAAAALRGVAAAEQWPQLDARGAYEHREESENTPFGKFIPRTDIHAAGLDASWELDLWGRVRRSVEAAGRELEVSEAELQAVGVSVAAAAARAYVDLRAAERRLAIASDNLALQQQTLALVRARLDAGLVVARDVAQAAASVETQRARLPLLAAARTAAANRLAVLLGLPPGELPAELLAPQPLAVPPSRVAVGTPADLLRARPDVRAAERRFAAAVARIGVATADQYPRFVLAGTLGLASNGAGKFFDDGSDVLGFGPSVRWSLFDGGRLRQRVVARTAEAEALQLAWERTVLVAVEEAEGAMARFTAEQERQQALAAAAQQARSAVRLSRAQYEEGLSDFQAVIDSQRLVATVEDDLATSEAAVVQHLVELYTALGGAPLGPRPEGGAAVAVSGR
jgi:NodT family efflux transporter outer membrane factor (OMF) lipoprotein